MIQSYGFTPSQRVFGKNPDIPGDLMSEPQAVVPNTCSLHDDSIARAYALRTTARKAVLELHDDRTLRKALLARPRRDKPFASGDVVAYWRDQKWHQGLLSKGGKWYGSGVVLGLIGRNVVIAHRNHIPRCAPEQVRLATQEEKALIETQGTELLGIKDMIEGGTFRSSQYVDLISQAYPPQEQDVIPPVQSAETTMPDPPSVQPETALAPEPPSLAAETVDKSPVSGEELPPKANAEPCDVPEASSSSSSSASGSSAALPQPTDESAYGPVRRSRILAKSGPLTMFRPAAMKHDDFVEVMNEVVPQLIEQTVMADDTTGSERKREAAETSDAPSAKVPKTEVSADCVEHGVAYVEHAACSVTESCELWESFRDAKDNAVTITNEHRKRSLQAVMSLFFRQRSTRPRSLNGKLSLIRALSVWSLPRSPLGSVGTKLTESWVVVLSLLRNLKKTL